MKQILLIFAVVVGQSALAADRKPRTQSEIIDKAIRDSLEGKFNKHKGELTEEILARLKALHLENTEITNAGLIHLANKMKQLPNLRILYLGGTKITNGGLDSVGKMKQLTTLSLHKCPNISDVGLKALARCQNLKTLRLKKTKVTKMCVGELKKKLPNCKINVEKPKRPNPPRESP